MFYLTRQQISNVLSNDDNMPKDFFDELMEALTNVSQSDTFILLFDQEDGNGKTLDGNILFADAPSMKVGSHLKMVGADLPVSAILNLMSEAESKVS